MKLSLKGSVRGKTLRGLIIIVIVNVVFIYLICTFFFNVNYNWSIDQQSSLSKEDIFLTENAVQHNLEENLKNILLKNQLAQNEILLKSKQFHPRENEDLQFESDIKTEVDLEQENLFDEILSALDKIYPNKYYNDVEDYIVRHTLFEEALQKIKEINSSDDLKTRTRKFLSKAKTQGYDIQLNRNLDIVSIRKIHQ